MTTKVLSSGPHSRRFGVEIEHGMRGGVSYVSGLFEFRAGDRRNPEGWSISSDGSGVELKTPILQGVEGFNTLREAMERLKRFGGYVTEADGLHVHHDAPEFVSNPNAVVQLVRSWRNNIDAIHQLVADRRRRSGACPAWDEERFNWLLDWQRRGGSLHVGRNDLNVSSLSEHGSIELRLHEGTLDPDVAIAWIMFGQKFIADVLKRVKPISPSASDERLMSRIRLSKEARMLLAAKQGRDSAASAYNGS